MENLALTDQISKDTFRYIITEANAPTSFDPLDADSTENLPAMRMMYLTPLEISPNDDLTSTVLESFHYDEKNKLIHWKVRPGLQFADGSPITPDDVAFAVSRMAFKRPKFPVIEHIEGLQQWREQPNALSHFPTGIKVKDQEISIQLTQNVAHPLFRFCLELFSIIPKKSVDLKSNTLLTKKAPVSGYYDLEKESQNGWLFKKRKSFEKIYGFKSPEQILFQFIPSTEVVKLSKFIDKNTVIASHEGLFSSSEMDELLKNLNVRILSSARFGVVLFNPNVKPFDQVECRQVFANTFRDILKNDRFKNVQIESSVFTKIIPGYMSSDDLKKMISLLDDQENHCKKLIQKSKIKWGYVKGIPNSTFSQGIQKTVEVLKLPDAIPVVFNTKAEMTDAFVKGEISVIPAFTGFWAHDPTGDLQMLFTPNLHKVLSFVNCDKKLNENIVELRKETDPGKIRKKFEEINQYLYKESLFNAFAHFRRFYVSHKSTPLKNLPIGITSPAPWQVFSHE